MIRQWFGQKPDFHPANKAAPAFGSIALWVQAAHSHAPFVGFDLARQE
jgi:hypothetical protein